MPIEINEAGDPSPKKCLTEYRRPKIDQGFEEAIGEEFDFDFEEDVTPLENPRILKPVTQTSDPDAKLLHAEAVELYRKANKIYRETPGRKGEFIDIYSGLRKTKSQANLFFKYYEYKFGRRAEEPGARSPGSSYHEYGLAIDIIHKHDTKRLREALIKAKWHQRYPKEPWHFEASGIPSWKKLDAKIKKIQNGHSYQYRRKIWRKFCNEHLVAHHQPDWEEEDKKLKKRARDLKREKTEIQNAKRKLKKLQNDIRAEQNKITRDKKRLIELRKDLRTFKYTYCPNNYSYPRCSHKAQKRKYDREKADKKTRISQLEKSIKTDKKSLAEKKRRYRKELSEYKKKFAAYRKKEVAYKNAKRINDKFAQDLRKFTAQAKRMDGQLIRLLPVIEAAVKDVTV